MAELNVERDFEASAGDVWEKLGRFRGTRLDAGCRLR